MLPGDEAAAAATAAASNKTMTVTNDHRGRGFVWLRMSRKPVNSINQAFLSDFLAVLDVLEANKTVQGMILTSAVPKIFSAGLDITEMYRTTRQRHRTWWMSLQTLWMRLRMTRLATVAAINGACPAAGCMLAMSCDYRIMVADRFTIGLNETQLGIVAPTWFAAQFREVVGPRQADRLLQLGALVGAGEALSIGLIDELVDAPKLTMAVDDAVMRFLAVPARARVMTKQMMRQKIVQDLKRTAEQEWEMCWALVSQPAVQKSLGAVMAKLSARKSAPRARL